MQKTIKKYFKIVISFLLFLLLFTCFTPPEGTQQVTLLNFIDKMIHQYQSITNKEDNFDKRGKLFFKETKNINNILYFKKGNSISIYSKKELKSPYVYSIEGNKYFIRKDLYLTSLGEKDLYFSFDNINWLKVDSKNVDVDLGTNDNLEDTNDGTNINIYYSTAFYPKKDKKYISLKEDRKIIQLSKDMILSDKEKKEITIDLTKNILFVPKGTIICGELEVDSNIVKSEYFDDKIKLTALRDIYFYANFNKKQLSMSFDKKDWTFLFFSIKISSYLKVKAISDKKIKVSLIAKFLYKEKKDKK